MQACLESNKNVLQEPSYNNNLHRMEGKSRIHSMQIKRLGIPTRLHKYSMCIFYLFQFETKIN